MTVAVDTNMLLDLLVPGAPDAAASQARLDEAYHRGALTICEAVYAELAARFHSQQELDRFLPTSSSVLTLWNRPMLCSRGIAATTPPISQA